MINVTISEELGEKCPEMALGTIYCQVKISKYNDELWNEINFVQQQIKDKFILSNIKDLFNIAATRDIYRKCGKDPHRYRPSAESLFRRILKGNNLYQINTLVDLINLFSLQSGYSIGGFDADKIKGDLTAGVGKKDEEYIGIGRGVLNIEGMPVLRDRKGGIGTPTSDEERTALSDDTRVLFMNINAYTGKEELLPFMDHAIAYLKKYINAKDIEIQIVTYNNQDIDLS